jgi:histidine triad (HIT) family protein
MEDSIFTKIIKRELPAEIVYEDEDTLAFLDIYPNNPGHTLVVPKKPVRNIFDTDDETLTAVMRTVRKIAPAVRDAVSAKGLNINSNHEAEAGQVVFHLHVHIIPRFEKHEFEFFPTKQLPKESFAEVGEKIRAALAR